MKEGNDTCAAHVIDFIIYMKISPSQEWEMNETLLDSSLKSVIWNSGKIFVSFFLINIFY